MTARERVLISRLVEKLDNNKNYARQIGLSYAMATVDSHARYKPMQEQDEQKQKEAQNVGPSGMKKDNDKAIQRLADGSCQDRRSTRF